MWNYAEFVPYVGIIPFIFALSILFGKRSKVHIFFVSIAIVSALLALRNPISIIPYKYNFPFLSSMQPSRIIFVLAFSLVTLASFGFEQLQKKSKSKQIFLVALSVLAGLTFLFAYTLLNRNNFSQIYGFDPYRVAFRNLILPVTVAASFTLLLLLSSVLKNLRPLIISAILVLTLAELFRFAYKFTSFSKLSWIFPNTNTTDFLSSQPKPFRLLTTDRRILNANTSAVYKLENVAGYDPLFLKNYAQLVTVWESGKVSEPGSFNRFVTPQKFDSKISNFLNTRYIVTFLSLIRI